MVNNKRNSESTLHQFLNENPGIKTSHGTFFALKPFYVRLATTKDLEMCCCKKHLHARWVIKAMIENCEKQMIGLGHINDYYTFFEQVTQHCKKEEHTNITWDCTPDKKSCCNHILTEWHNLKTSIFNKMTKAQKHLCNILKR